MAAYKIKGIVEAETPCECCGNTNLKRSVILEPLDGGDVIRVGTTCAGYLMLGKKTKKNGEQIASEAAARNYATKWISVHGTSFDVLQKIASSIRAYHCPATVYHGELLIGSEMTR